MVSNIDLEEDIKNFYQTDEYIIKNPSLHEEDSPWKVSKIIPLLDRFVEYNNQYEINLLDVGGGAGLILNAVSIYLKKKYNINVKKNALDLSPGMLKIQKKRNPDLNKALNEDIRKTSLGEKEMDLTLMIDILEHVPNPVEALDEVKRISNFVIFKVPLEDNFLERIRNVVKGGKRRRSMIETFGHINIYNFMKLKYHIEKHTGQVLEYYFTNSAHEHLTHYKNKMKKISRFINFVASYLFRISPKLCSLIFSDDVMILARCYNVL